MQGFRFGLLVSATMLIATPNASAKFLQPDPIGYQDQMNLYAYVGNDPINMVDPTGMCGTRKADGTCDVLNSVAPSSNNYADAQKAEQALETRMNALDTKINALGANDQISVVDSSGNAVGTITGADLQNKWNNTTWNVTDVASNNGGVGAVVSNFATQGDPSSWTSATVNAEYSGVLGYAAHGAAGLNYQILHDNGGHLSLPGLQSDQSNWQSFYNPNQPSAPYVGSSQYIANEIFANQAAKAIAGQISVPVIVNPAYGY